jgi:hypothetical protein
MKLHVISLETEPIYTYVGKVIGGSLLKSCEMFDINLRIIGQDMKEFNFGNRVQEYQIAFADLDDNDIAVVLDFRDTIILDSSYTIIDKFLKMDVPILWSSELFCLPAWYSLGDKFPDHGHKGRYLNGGMYMGYVKNLKELFDAQVTLRQKLIDKDKKYFDLLAKDLDEDGKFSSKVNGNLLSGKRPEEHDQVLFHLLYLSGKYGIEIDYENNIFQNVQMATRHGKYVEHQTTLFDLVFNYQIGFVKNELYNTVPSIFHSPGGPRFLSQLNKMLG